MTDQAGTGAGAGAGAGDSGAAAAAAAAAAAGATGADAGAKAGTGEGAAAGTGAAKGGEGAIAGAGAAAGAAAGDAGGAKAGGDAAGAAAAGAAPAWGDDWREKMAGGDEKKQKLLERYASPLAAVDALHEMRTKMSKGEIKVVNPLKPNATPEELKAWRADNGIPETWQGYDTTIEDGHVWGDADKPVLESFTQAAHEANLPPTAVKAALKWYEGHQAKVIETQLNEDAAFKKANIDELASEWGGALNREVAIATEFFQKLPDGLGEALMGARDGSGRLLMANAKFIRWANAMERQANPAATVMPSSGIHAAQALESELDSIKELMRDPNSKYYKGPESAKLNARYLALLEAKEKAGKR